MSNRRRISISTALVTRAVVALLLVGTVVAASSVIGTFFLEGQLEEPLSGSETGQTWTSTLYPNESTTHVVDLSNYNSSVDYIVKVEIESYEDLDTPLLTNRTKAVAAARDENHSAFIKNIVINGSHGYHVDLLNDGVAYYNTIPPNTTEQAKFQLHVNEDVEKYGTVSLNLSFERVERFRAKDDLYHRDDGFTCTGSNCHDTNKSVAVHQVYNITKNAECDNCHGRSFEDTHMTCTAACHDGGYPIEVNDSSAYDHGPDSPMGVSGNYYCSENCHGTQISSAHTIRFDQYCAACHSSENASIHSYHDNYISDDCLSCHGLNSERIHGRYEANHTHPEYQTEANNQCVRCHGSGLPN